MEENNNNMNMGQNMDQNRNMGGGEMKEGSAGPIIGIIIILAIIILGGLYFWGQSNNEAMMEGDVESIENQSGEDTTSSIEADLDSTDVENVDAEINAS